ncbi:hypothetical protein M5689_006342 [Euphorbia peplus]|nr:hypothetical protein M5689_006342 [Euphorbia peplus]
MQLILNSALSSYHMPKLSVSYEAILCYSLTQLGSPAPRFQYENGQSNVHACRVFYTFRDPRGDEHPFDICSQSSVSQAESKKSACYAALLALQRLHGLIIVDCNFLNLLKAKEEYLSSMAAYKDNVIIPYSKLSTAYDELKARIEAASHLISGLQPILDRITRLF